MAVANQPFRLCARPSGSILVEGERLLDSCLSYVRPGVRWHYHIHDSQFAKTVVSRRDKRTSSKSRNTGALDSMGELLQVLSGLVQSDRCERMTEAIVDSGTDDSNNQ